MCTLLILFSLPFTILNLLVFHRKRCLGDERLPAKWLNLIGEIVYGMLRRFVVILFLGLAARCARI